MGLIKINSKDGIFLSDGQYATSGRWIADLDKIPYGELFKENLKIKSVSKNPQLSLIQDEENKDFSRQIPKHFHKEVFITPVKFVLDGDKEIATAFTSNEHNIVAWVSDEYLKLFNDVKYENVYCNSDRDLVCFVNEDKEFLFGIMPMTFDDQFKYFEFMSQYYYRKQFNKKITLLEEIEKAVISKN